MTPGIDADSTHQSPGAPSTYGRSPLLFGHPDPAPTPGLSPPPPLGFVLFGTRAAEAPEDPAVTIELTTDALSEMNSTAGELLQTVVHQTNTVLEVMQAMAGRLVQHEELDAARHEELKNWHDQAATNVLAVDEKLVRQQAQLAAVILGQTRQAEITERARLAVDAQFSAMRGDQRALMEEVSLRCDSEPCPSPPTCLTIAVHCAPPPSPS